VYGAGAAKNLSELALNPSLITLMRHDHQYFKEYKVEHLYHALIFELTDAFALENSKPIPTAAERPNNIEF